MKKIKSNLNFVVLIAGIILLAILAPYLPSQILHILILVFFFASVSTSWDILGGLTGQMSFGHSLFVGVGGYVSLLLFLNMGLTPWIGMFISGVVAALIGGIMGFLSFRYGIEGFYFALITIVFVEVARYIALSLEWTGGAKGLYMPYSGQSFFNFQFDSKFIFLYIIVIIYLAIILIYHLIMKSKIGYYFLAIRENQDAAESIGINAFKYKMYAVIISAFLAGVAGAFWAQYITFIDPYTMFDFMLSVQIIIYAVAGGRGTMFGPLVGAAILIPLSEVLRTQMGQGAAGIHLLIYGLILIFVIRFMPDGIIVWTKDRLSVLRGMK